MASPHVAGLVACLLTEGKSSHRGGKLAKAKSIRNSLNDIAIDIGAEGIDNETGLGFVTYLDGTEFDAILPRGDKRLHSAVVN
jgi:hypothetical protein